MPNLHVKQLPVVDSCHGCGACCLAQSTPPAYAAYLSGVFSLDDGTDDAARVKVLPDHLRLELELHIQSLESGECHPNGEVCLWYDESTKQCKHYDLRPQICRDFELDSDICHSWRRQFGIGQSNAPA